MIDTEFNAIVCWLRTPAAYPQPPKHVEVVETHTSIVFIAGSFVYKLKRRVKYDFLDFTTIEGRETACREEVRLNRRLTADVYLDVLPITRDTDGLLHLGGDGAVVDWLVHMRRLPIEKTLDSLHELGKLRSEHIDRLAHVLARFYQGLLPVAITPLEYRVRFIQHVQGNLRELLAVSHHCPRSTVRRIHSFQLQFLHLHSEIFDQRVRDGRIIEGHGDLRPEHICFSEPLSIFDCIEFSSEFRQIDVADEVSFLAAECDFIGANWIGTQLPQILFALLYDQPPPILLDFYKSYRACVRAKVSALRADQVEDRDRKMFASQSVKHLNLANSYVRLWIRPFLLVVGGLSGTGKSTVACELANTLGCELLQTDVIRQDLFASSPGPAAFEGGIFTRDMRHRVYEEMLRRAESILRDGVSAVLDGTFSMSATVALAHNMAINAGYSFIAIECVCSPVTARRRIAQRLAQTATKSEVRPEFYGQQRSCWEPWPDSIPRCCIDTEQSLRAQIEWAIRDLRSLLNV